MRGNGRMRRFVIALVLCCGAACTAERPATETTGSAPKTQRPAPPTAADAEALIKGSMEFGEFDFTNAGWTAPAT